MEIITRSTKVLIGRKIVVVKHFQVTPEWLQRGSWDDVFR